LFSGVALCVFVQFVSSSLIKFVVEVSSTAFPDEENVGNKTVISIQVSDEAHFTHVSVGKNPIGCGSRYKFVPMSIGACLILNLKG
jgi:hypothetical protein